MKNDERGIAMVIEIVLLGAVLVAVGYGVWMYLQNTKKASDSASSTETKSETKAAAKAWTDGGPAVSGKYADADIVEVSATQWRMYYATQPEGGQLDVYSATSTDGKTWTQEPGKRKSMATFPSVIKLKDGRYRLYYQNAGTLKSALSTDGLSFTDEPGTRIDLTNPDNLTFDNVAAPTVLEQDDGTFLMVYRGTINTRYAADTPNPTTQVLMWATSADGLAWTKKGLAVDTRNATLAGQLDGPELVVMDDKKVHVFATSYTGVYEFTFDGSKFSTGEKAFALGQSSNSNKVMSAPPPGDPTVAKIGSDWFMYYGAMDGIHYATLK